MESHRYPQATLGIRSRTKNRPMVRMEVGEGHGRVNILHCYVFLQLLQRESESHIRSIILLYILREQKNMIKANK